MATIFQNDTIFEGNNNIEIHLQAYGDTDQAAVTVVDLSAILFPDNQQAGHLGVAGADSLTLLEISWDVQGFNYVQLLWDAATPDEIITMSLQSSKSFWPTGGKHDPKSTTHVGDILVTTVGAVADSSYDIKVLFRKHT